MSRYRSRNDESKQGSNYLSLAASGLIVAILAELFFPNVIPFGFLELVGFKGSISHVLGISTPLFIWGVVINIIVLQILRGKYYSNYNPGETLKGGLILSLFAGITEEIAFRWLIFFNQIVAYTIGNWILFGFTGHGLLEWFYNAVEAPIANFLTLGILSDVLHNSFGWAAGAAMLTSNLKFRDGHAYQGILGWANSWFCGMFFFYLTFHHGLISAILVHILFDIVVAFVVYFEEMGHRLTANW